ncbi:hypothetical protein FPV67DRAFT_1445536 [Lyophyllum atratum]|nr:hypothetical protein FPV67DRAFT_1445536 [Lyophyllum atratum]
MSPNACDQFRGFLSWQWVAQDEGDLLYVACQPWGVIEGERVIEALVEGIIRDRAVIYPLRNGPQESADLVTARSLLGLSRGLLVVRDEVQGELQRARVRDGGEGKYGWGARRALTRGKKSVLRGTRNVEDEESLWASPGAQYLPAESAQDVGNDEQFLGTKQPRGNHYGLAENSWSSTTRSRGSYSERGPWMVVVTRDEGTKQPRGNHYGLAENSWSSTTRSRGSYSERGPWMVVVTRDEGV